MEYDAPHPKLPRSETELREITRTASVWMDSASTVRQLVARNASGPGARGIVTAVRPHLDEVWDFFTAHAAVGVPQPDSIDVYRMRGVQSATPVCLVPLMPRDAAMLTPGGVMHDCATRQTPGNILYQEGRNLICFAGLQSVSPLGKGVLLFTALFHARNHVNGIYADGNLTRNPQLYWREQAEKHDFEFGLLDSLHPGWSKIVDAFYGTIDREGAADHMITRPERVIGRPEVKTLHAVFDAKVAEEEIALWGGVAYRHAIYRHLARAHGGYAAAKTAFAEFLRRR